MARSKSNVTNTLRKLRLARGEMTQQTLAEQLGVARQTVIAIEQGRFCPSLETALRMERIFGVPVGEIFRLEDDS